VPIQPVTPTTPTNAQSSVEIPENKINLYFDCYTKGSPSQKCVKKNEFILFSTAKKNQKPTTDDNLKLVLVARAHPNKGRTTCGSHHLWTNVNKLRITLFKIVLFSSIYFN
jgi:hypothetical protein